MAERNVARDEDAKRAKVEAQEKAVAEASMEQPATAAEKRRDEAAERKRARADAALAAQVEAAERKRAKADAALAAQAEAAGRKRAKADAALAAQAEASERKRAMADAALAAKADAALAAQAEAAERKRAEADSALDAALAAQHGKAGAVAEAQAHFQRVKVDAEGKEDARLLVEQLRFQKMKVEKQGEESGTGYAPLPDFDLSSEGAADASCAAAVADFFSEGNMERSTCACCNELFARKLMKYVPPRGDWLERLTSRLSWVHTTHPLTQKTRDFYDASSKVAELGDVALAPSGVICTKSTSDEVGDYKVV